MITVAATVQFGTEPAVDTEGVDFPGLVEWVGSAQDGEGTFYVTIADELGDALVECGTTHVEPFLGSMWVEGEGGAYWYTKGVTRVGIRPEDITEELAR